MSKKKHRDRHPPAPQPPQDTSGGDDVAAERDDLLGRLQRVSADYVNYQKRIQRDIDEARTFANADLIKGLLPVLDDMERALEAARENHGEDDPLFAGLQLIHDKALETLRQFGLATISAVGEVFDPDRHAAMLQQPTDEHPPQTVLTELQKGYALQGRTIRPAAVVVSKEPDEDTPPEDAQD